MNENSSSLLVERSASTNLDNQIHIIGIGASAGGLEAIQALFNEVPDNCNYSFVVVQHLSPDYKSLMGELLTKNTHLQIIEVTDGIEIKSGTIYLIPPKKNMTYQNGKLLLKDKPDSHELNFPIDIFFNSLANGLEEKAIGIILSGTGTDGTKGIQSIKDCGGLTFAQDPKTAKFDGMPKSAIETGRIDKVIEVDHIFQNLEIAINHLELEQSFNFPSSSTDEENILKLLNIIRLNTNINFSGWKRPTLLRRISRRMTLTDNSSLSNYLDFIKNNRQEIEILHKDFMIGVTSFFRDQKAFDELKKELITYITESKSHQDFKVWTSGCSTGEEVYSLAIILDEIIHELQLGTTYKIFATDINQNALDVAYKGVYNADITSQVNKERLEKYFTISGGRFQIAQKIRNRVIFSRHDILKDPPFINVDLVTCRNLLIYLESEVQKKVINRFHYALKTGALLMLGLSESIAPKNTAFSTIHSKWKIFKNQAASKFILSEPGDNPNIRGITRNTFRKTTLGGPYKKINHQFLELLSKTLINHFGVAAVVTDSKYDVLNAIGDYTNYMNLPDDYFSMNLLKMLPEHLAMATSTSIRKAFKEKKEVLYRGAKIKENDSTRTVDILVNAYGSSNEDVQYLIVFNEQLHFDTEEVQVIKDIPSDKRALERILELEEELNETKEYLQSTIEELETSSEELQTANQELLSSNEELQSMNEELQSVNEELQTVNAEHQFKISELISINSDLDNLIDSTEIATIFLNKELRIRKYTPVINEHFQLQDADIDRPIFHFNSNFGTENIANSAKLVMDTETPIQREIQSNDGKWYLMRITPFVTNKKEVDGVIVTFIDIHELKSTQNELAHQNDLFEQVIEGTMAGYWYRDIKNQKEFLSPSFKEMFGYTDAELPNTPEAWRKLLLPEDLNIVDKTYDKHISSHGKVPYDCEVRYHHKDGSTVWVYRRGKVIEWDNHGNPLKMVGSHVNITPLKNYSELERINSELDQFVYISSHDLQEPIRNISNYISLIKEEYSDPERKELGEYYDRIFNSADRMKKMIKGFLSLSRVGREIKFVQIDTSKLVNSVLEDMSTTIENTNVNITIHEMPKVWGLETELRQVFQNLISNSIKFRKESETCKIEISGKKIDGGWEFLVADNGVGMESVDGKKLFQIFQRMHVNSPYPGEGIGLAICKKIIDLHHGKIWAESEVNRGTSFYFTIMEGSMSHASNLSN